MADEIGIPTKASQELPLPAPCLGPLILLIRQTIGPGSTQRRSTTAVPRATQTVGLKQHLESVPFQFEEAHCGVTSSQRGLSDTYSREVTRRALLHMEVSEMAQSASLAILQTHKRSKR